MATKDKAKVYIEVKDDNYVTPTELVLSSMTLASQMFSEMAITDEDEIDGWAAITVIRRAR